MGFFDFVLPAKGSYSLKATHYYITVGIATRCLGMSEDADYENKFLHIIRKWETCKILNGFLFVIRIYHFVFRHSSVSSSIYIIKAKNTNFCCQSSIKIFIRELWVMNENDSSYKAYSLS